MGRDVQAISIADWGLIMNTKKVPHYLAANKTDQIEYPMATIAVCMLLIYLSVLSKPHRFSSAFIKRCEQAMPLHYAYLQKVGHVWSNSELGKRASQDESYLKELLDAVLE